MKAKHTLSRREFGASTTGLLLAGAVGGAAEENREDDGKAHALRCCKDDRLGSRLGAHA